MCAKLRTVAASNNRDHPTRSLYYCLFAPHTYIVVLRAHPVRGESCNQRHTTGEVATVSMFVVFEHVNSLAQFFSMKGRLVYCTYPTDVDGIMQELGYSHRSEKWRLFIGLSKLSLKAVLLHNVNMLPSIPVGYAAHMNERYENMKQLLQCINYEQYCWLLQSNCIRLLLEFQLVYTKHCCFCVNGTVVQYRNIT